MSYEIPDSIQNNWQKIVNILANIAEVPVALIMKVDRPYIEVFQISDTKNIPYLVGDREKLAGLYCERVINTKNKLLVKDARIEEDWKDNPDLEYGLVSYLGFPLIWPNNKVFGTICILDKSPNKFDEIIQELMKEFKVLIETHLELIFKNKRLEQLLEENQEYQRDLKKSKKEIEKALNRSNFFKKLISHDFNNILQNILSSIDLLRKYLPQLEKESKFKAILDILEKQVSKGTNMIKNAHVVSKLDNQNQFLYKINLCKILKNSIKQIKDSFSSKNIDINLSLQKEEIHIMGNELLENVFDNLLINAIKHNESSEIKIEIKGEINEEANVCKIKFSDNARGIPDDQKIKIFKETVNAKGNDGGLGIGLYLVRRIINLYNGKIWVEDRIEGDYSKGSKFILELPLDN